MFIVDVDISVLYLSFGESTAATVIQTADTKWTHHLAPQGIPAACNAGRGRSLILLFSSHLSRQE